MCWICFTERSLRNVGIISLEETMNLYILRNLEKELSMNTDETRDLVDDEAVKQCVLFDYDEFLQIYWFIYLCDDTAKHLRKINK